ncbi:MAG: hypothetical protein ACKVX7_02940 [Planctomycetota bacterium]
MADPTSAPLRHAKWQQPLDISVTFLRLSIERWLRSDGGLGWGTPDDPFPGTDNVRIRIFERDADVGETSDDDLIATFTGSFALAAIKPWVFNQSSGKYTKSRKPRSTVVFKPNGPPELPARVLDNSALDVIWVNFLGREEAPFRLEIPNDGAEAEGDFFEVAFTIEHPEMDGETLFTSRASLVRTREGVLLAVEPLPQFSLTLDSGHLHHAQILDFYHSGDKATRRRAWGEVVFKYRDDRTPAGQNTLGSAGCSIVSYTMILRYLRDPESSTEESIYERRIARAELASASKPFVKSAKDGVQFLDNDIPDHWWPARVAWFARTKAKYTERANENGKSLNLDGSVQGYMHAKFGLIENERQLNKLMGLTAETHEVNSKNWEEKRPIIKAALDRGLPVAGLFSRGAKGGHYVVIVGYYFEEVDGVRELRFVLNDAGTAVLRGPAKGAAGGIPKELMKKNRELSKFRIFEPEGWDPKTHSRFSPVMRRNPFVRQTDE